MSSRQRELTRGPSRGGPPALGPGGGLAPPGAVGRGPPGTSRGPPGALVPWGPRLRQGRPGAQAPRRVLAGGWVGCGGPLGIARGRWEISRPPSPSPLERGPKGPDTPFEPADSTWIVVVLALTCTPRISMLALHPLVRTQLSSLPRCSLKGRCAAYHAAYQRTHQCSYTGMRTEV